VFIRFPAYRIDPGGFDRNRWELGLGARFETRAGWRFSVGYRGTLDDSGDDHGLSIDLQRDF
jgi:large repetitive protein